MDGGTSEGPEVYKHTYTDIWRERPRRREFESKSMTLRESPLIVVTVGRALLFG